MNNSRMIFFIFLFLIGSQACIKGNDDEETGLLNNYYDTESDYDTDYCGTEDCGTEEGDGTIIENQISDNPSTNIQHNNAQINVQQQVRAACIQNMRPLWPCVLTLVIGCSVVAWLWATWGDQDCMKLYYCHDSVTNKPIYVPSLTNCTEPHFEPGALQEKDHCEPSVNGTCAIIYAICAPIVTILGLCLYGAANS